MEQQVPVHRISALKIIAVMLFIILPFIGFFLGMKYQEGVTPDKMSLPVFQPARIPNLSDAKSEHELMFVTYAPGVRGYRITGEITPPNGWLYWKIGLDSKRIQIVDKNDDFFKEFAQEGIEQGNIYNFNFSKAVGLDEHFGIGEENKLRNIREKGSSNFLVRIYRDTKLEVWKFNPTSSALTLVTVLPSNGCISGIIDWDSERNLLLGYTRKPDPTDSSSSDISNICLYDYKNQKVLLDYLLPVTKHLYYTQAFGTIQSKKVILDGSHIAVINLNSQDKNVLQDYEFFGYSRDMHSFIQNGVLPLQIKDSVPDEFLLSIYNLQNGKFSDPISFDRIPADTHIYDIFLSFVLDSDHVLVRYTVIREPQSTCWYLISNLSIKEKVLCTTDNEIYSQLYPAIQDLSTLRTEFVKWY